MIIAIDGPAASGKGTLARRLAAHLRRPHLDTGLIYRAVALALLDRGFALADRAEAERAARSLDPASLADPRLRADRTGEAASVVSAHPGVRDALLAFQRDFAAQPGGAVLDGRDIGTVVCPGADIKLFVTATPEERARRRHRELAAAGDGASFASVLTAIRARDARDESREAAPMRPAPDAAILDTTALDADAAFQAALALVTAATRVG